MFEDYFPFPRWDMLVCCRVDNSHQMFWQGLQIFSGWCWPEFDDIFTRQHWCSKLLQIWSLYACCTIDCMVSAGFWIPKTPQTKELQRSCKFDKWLVHCWFLFFNVFFSSAYGWCNLRTALFRMPVSPQLRFGCKVTRDIAHKLVPRLDWWEDVDCFEFRIICKLFLNSIVDDYGIVVN